MLGCEFLHGALHQIPNKRRQLWAEDDIEHVENIVTQIRVSGAFNLEELENQEGTHENDT